MWLVWNITMRGDLTPSLEAMNPTASMDWKVRQQSVAAVMAVPVELQSRNFREIAAALPCKAVAS